MGTMTSEKPDRLKYQQIRTELGRAIFDGRFKIGDKLPSERELAKQFGVSPYTIRHALFLIEQEGMVEKVPSLGTFLRSSEPAGSMSTEALSRNDGGSIALVLANVPDEGSSMYSGYMSYHTRELRVMDQHLAKIGRSLMVAYTDSRDLAAGKLPLALEQGNVAGVILDGIVEDFHAMCLQSRGFSVVAIGNRPIHVPVSRLYYDYPKAAYLVTKALLDVDVESIHYVTYPFMHHYDHEIFDGYSRACIETGRPVTTDVLNEYEHPEKALRTAFARSEKSFGLLLTCDVAKSVEMLYQELGWTPEDHPIASLYRPEGVNQDFASGMITFGEGMELVCEMAVELMDHLLADGEPRTVVLEPKLSGDGSMSRTVTWQKP